MENTQDDVVLVQTRKTLEMKIIGLEISTDTIILILKYAMEAVEATTMTGPSKRTAVIDLVRRIVIDSPIEDHVEAILLEMINDGILGHMIDFIVSASRGELHLNAVLNTGKIACPVFLKKCLPCNK